MEDVWNKLNIYPAYDSIHIFTLVYVNPFINYVWIGFSFQIIGYSSPHNASFTGKIKFRFQERELCISCEQYLLLAFSGFNRFFLQVRVADPTKFLKPDPDPSILWKLNPGFGFDLLFKLESGSDQITRIRIRNPGFSAHVILINPNSIGGGGYLHHST